MPKLPPPADWPRMSSSIFYQDASAAIDWLCRTFGFEVRLKIEGDEGRIVHGELTYGDGLIMVGEEGALNDGRPWKHAMKSPKSVGGVCTQSIMFYVDDAEAHYQHARSYGALDLEGHMCG